MRNLFIRLNFAKFVFILLIMTFYNFEIFSATRIAILEFTQNSKNVSQETVKFLTEFFTVEMVNSKDFVVVERAKLDAALKEMQLQNRDEFDDNSAVELGKLSGAEMVFYGSVSSFGGKYHITIKGMDVKTATLKYAINDSGVNDKALLEVCKRIAHKISEDVSVAEVSHPATTKTTLPPNQKTSEVSRDNMSNIDSILTYQELKIKQTYIDLKWRINVTDYQQMKNCYRQQIGAGAALASLGGTFLVSSIILFSVFFSPTVFLSGNSFMNFVIGFSSGLVTLVPGIVFGVISHRPFLIAHCLNTISRKATGKALSFFQRSSVGGGYDWTRKEVTVAMAIKL